MGLLNGVLDNDMTRFGLGLLAASGPNDPQKGAFGNRLMQAVGSFDDYRQQKAQQERAKQAQEFQAFQMETMKAQAMQQAAAQKREEEMRQGAAQFFKPGQAGLAPLMGDAETGILPSQGRAPVSPSVDVAGLAGFYVRQGAVDKALPLFASLNKQSEFSPEVRYDQNGRAFMTAKDGSVKFLDGISARDKLEEVRLGDKVAFRSPYSTEMQGSMLIGQSPDSKASNALGWANNAISRENLNLQKQNAKAAPSGYQWNADGTALVGIKGGPADASNKPLTEGQAKAYDFTGRMEQANNIITKLAESGVKKAIPFQNAGWGVGTAMNTLMVPGEWQQLDQAKRQWINSALRRESGAVIGAEEFANFDKTYFPQMGEGKEVIANKARAREALMSGVAADIPAPYRARMPTYGNDLEKALSKY